MIRVYYQVKPLIPWRFRQILRRWHVRRTRRSSASVWPILPGSEQPPRDWPGWPEGKQFAFVVTHDVEGARGLARCRDLMKLDLELGFRSSFNFVPEGEYRVPAGLRDELKSNGFEIGVHGLHHDGKLYSSRKTFQEQARRINEYLQEWEAVGFRSPFMHHNLDWMHDLNVRYDASTFDTDPFEPQPDGVSTIFPFWVPGPMSQSNLQPSSINHQHSLDCGYVELPYTLPQDSTLFVYGKEPGIEIWKRKLDWIVEHGGMAMVIVHPDYVAFDGKASGPDEFPVTLYRELLEYVKRRHAGAFWQALPREVAAYVHQHREKLPMPSSVRSPVSPKPTPSVKIWIDLDNTPHVPFFIPVIRELKKRGHRVVLTARDAFQVCELAEEKGMRYVKIGRHYGKNPVRKVMGLVWRSTQLIPFCLRERPHIALSHGARSQVLLSNLLRIPTIVVTDYEFTKAPFLVRPRWEIVPDSISSEESHSVAQRVRRYRGIKEDVYAPDFKPDPSILDELGLRDGDIIVTVRPPASEAHYHNPESELLLNELMARLCQAAGVRAVLLPRNKQQGDALRRGHPDWFANGKTIVPSRALDGLNLLWFSDLVVSGGGTMNREAAALGVPVYSIFRGKTGAVDRRLEQEGRLIMIRSVEEVRTRIDFKWRDKSSPPDNRPRAALQDIVDHIEEIMRIEYPGRQAVTGGPIPVGSPKP